MIRVYEPNDLDVIMDIGNRAWRPIYAMFRRVYGDDLFAVQVPDEFTSKGEQIRRHCDTHPDWAYVCEEQGRIVGFITFLLDPVNKMGEIGNNAVDPACGLKGVGQQMYKAVLERFRREGLLFAKVRTGLDEAHAPARRAYEHAGFNIRHEDVTYYCKL